MHRFAIVLSALFAVSALASESVLDVEKCPANVSVALDTYLARNNQTWENNAAFNFAQTLLADASEVALTPSLFKKADGKCYYRAQNRTQSAFVVISSEQDFDPEDGVSFENERMFLEFTLADDAGAKAKYQMNFLLNTISSEGLDVYDYDRNSAKEVYTKIGSSRAKLGTVKFNIR